MKNHYPLTAQEMFLDRGLACVRRYSRKHLNKPKSVAEHCHDVEVKSGWICLLLIDQGVEVDELEVSWEARVHDDEEAITGDFINPTKYGDGLTEEEVREIEAAFSAIAIRAIDLIYQEMPEVIRKRSIAAWHRYKDRTTIESRIVKLADILSGMAECAEERGLGNTTLREDEERYRRLYEEFKQENDWVGLLRELLP